MGWSVEIMYWVWFITQALEPKQSSEWSCLLPERQICSCSKSNLWRELVCTTPFQVFWGRLVTDLVTGSHAAEHRRNLPCAFYAKTKKCSLKLEMKEMEAQVILLEDATFSAQECVKILVLHYFLSKAFGTLPNCAPWGTFWSAFSDGIFWCSASLFHGHCEIPSLFLSYCFSWAPQTQDHIGTNSGLCICRILSK